MSNAGGSWVFVACRNPSSLEAPRPDTTLRVGRPPGFQHAPAGMAGDKSVSKGNERKKDLKKKPAKSFMEKRAAKVEKRNQKKQRGIA